MTANPIRCVHVIVPEPDGSVGGADMHVRDLAVAQAKRGNARPVVFTTLSHSFARRIRDVGVECFSTAGRSQRAVLPELRRLIARRRIEIVHSHGYEATWWAVAALATLRRPPPLVVTCHGWIETTPKLKAWSALDRLANRYASGVIVVSDELIAPALPGASRARVFALVPNGVPPAPPRVTTAAARALTRERWGLRTGVPLVGAMGRLALEKRHDVFIDASRLIAASSPDVHFLIAGGGPLRAQLTQQIAAAGLSERFQLLGVVERSAGAAR